MSAPLPDKPGAINASAASAPLPVYESGQLFESGKEILIRHGGELYRLRLTRQNKLILTK